MMRSKGYTTEQIQILNKNSNVVMVKYGKQIEYEEYFKKWAVIQSLSHPEMSAIQIFELAGFDRSIIRSRTADSRLRYWKGNYFRYNRDIDKPKTDIKSESLEKQNNSLLLLLISRFDYLISILRKR